MLKAYSTSPQFWRVAAEQIRQGTNQSSDLAERRVLSDIADGYDWLARHASERLARAVTRHSQQDQTPAG